MAHCNAPSSSARHEVRRGQAPCRTLDHRPKPETRYFSHICLNLRVGRFAFQWYKSKFPAHTDNNVNARRLLAIWELPQNDHRVGSNIVKPGAPALRHIPERHGHHDSSYVAKTHYLDRGSAMENGRKNHLITRISMVIFCVSITTGAKGKIDRAVAMYLITENDAARRHSIRSALNPVLRIVVNSALRETTPGPCHTSVKSHDACAAAAGICPRPAPRQSATCGTCPFGHRSSKGMST